MRRSTARSDRESSSAWSSKGRRAGALVVGGIATAIALGACSAGQIAETASIESAIPGVNAQVGDIAIRNALVAFPTTDTGWQRGADVPLELRIVNTGTSADELTSVSSDISRSVELKVVPAGGQLTGTPTPAVSAPTGAPSQSVSGQPSAPPSAGTANPTGGTPAVASSPSASAGGNAAPSASARSKASPTVAGSPSASPVPSGQTLPLTIQPEVVVSLDAGQPQLVLTGVEQSFDPSQTVTVTLRFQHAGTVQLKIPVSPPATPLPRTSLTHD